MAGAWQLGESRHRQSPCRVWDHEKELIDLIPGPPTARCLRLKRGPLNSTLYPSAWEVREGVGLQAGPPIIASAPL